MKLDSLELTFHRTVRVAEGRQPSNLPPSLGRMELYRVDDYSKKCPKNWERKGFFVALHDTEAMWLSFHSNSPVALLIGAGGINALTGEKLGTTLEKDNYCVAPPQPWLDGWKDKDGTVYQFISTPYQKGEGITVAEQLIGKESKTGALGIAVFNPIDRTKLKSKILPHEGWTDSAYGSNITYAAGSAVCSFDSLGGGEKSIATSGSFLKSAAPMKHSATRSLRASKGITGQSVNSTFSEMGIGKGGKIIQKIYPDPYGLEVWRTEPSATLAVYLVNAHVFEQITGIKVPAPVGHEIYDGKWFGMNDKTEGDVAGSEKFTGLKSAVFPASKMNETPAPEKAKKPKKSTESVVGVK
jgi:hypothetical protein